MSSTRCAALFLLFCVVFLGVLPVVWSSPAIMIDSEHARLSAENAAQTEKINALKERVDSIENRLFAIFLAAGGAMCGSMATALISLSTHRRVGRKEG